MNKNKLVAYSNEQNANGKHYGCEEEHEVHMILDTDAVVDPWAVMIKPFNTLIASTTMP